MKKLVLFLILVFQLELLALPDSVKKDMLKAQLVQELKDQKYTDALKTIDKLKAMKVKLPDSMIYFEGKALFESGKKYESYFRFEKYVTNVGKDGKYYNETINYLIKAEKIYQSKKAEMDRIDKEYNEMIRIQNEKKAKEEQKRKEKEEIQRADAKEFEKQTHTFLDNETGLMWIKPFEKKYFNNPYITIKTIVKKSEAKSYCEKLKFGGFDDWRLPSIKEFYTIRPKKFNNVINWGKEYYSQRNSWEHLQRWLLGDRDFKKKYDKRLLLNNDSIYSFTFSENGDWSRKESHKEPLYNETMCVREDRKNGINDYYTKEYTTLSFKGNIMMIEDRYKNLLNFGDRRIGYWKEYCSDLVLGGFDDWRVPTGDDMQNKISCKFNQYLRFPVPSGFISRKVNIFEDEVYQLYESSCKLSKYGSNYSGLSRCVRDVKTDEKQ